MNRRNSQSGVLRSVFNKLVVCCLLLFPAGVSAGEGRWAILVSGASGDSDLQKRYLQEITELHSILEDPLGFSPEGIIVLFDDPSKNPELIRNTSTRENLQACHGMGGSNIRELSNPLNFP